MIVKKSLLKKMLSNGQLAEVSLIRRDAEPYSAGLFLAGRFIPGPPLPVPLEAPRGEVTHSIGGRPAIGLTQSEAVKIRREVEMENAMLNRA